MIKFPKTNSHGECLCIACCEERRQRESYPYIIGQDLENFRYACEICGNKRCPHHSDHRNPCTDSNESGQPGSVYTKVTF